MPRFILPAVLFGVALVVFFHFFVKLALFVLIVGGAARFIRSRLFGGSTGRGGWQNHRLAFTDKIRQMSDDEYAAFRQPRWLNKSDQTGASVGFHSENFVL